MGRLGMRGSMSSDPSAGTSPGGGHRLAVHGGHLDYDVAGGGEPVLLIHSAIADRRLWNREFIDLARRHRAVRFDLRGYGGSTPAGGPFSYVEDIGTLLDHLQVRRAFLVGSSMGGARAVDFALTYPERVSGMLLAAPGLSGGLEPPFTPEEQAAFEYDERKSTEIAKAWSGGDKARAVDLLGELWCSALAGSERELFRRMVEENSAEVFEDRSARLAENERPAFTRLAEVKAPTVVLVGDRDNPSSPVFAQRVASAIPNAKLVTVPGADHLVNLSRPREFDAALHSMLRRVG